MNRTRFAVKALLFLSLAACGDSREEFSGNYGITGEFTYSGGGRTQVETVQGQLDVIADHFDSERLFMNLDCGLNAKMGDENATLIQKNCPPYRVEDCILTYKYTQGRVQVDGDTLTLTGNGEVGLVCNGGSGSVRLDVKISGVRGKIMPLAGSGQQGQDGKLEPTVLHGPSLVEALRRQLEASAR